MASLVILVLAAVLLPCPAGSQGRALVQAPNITIRGDFAFEKEARYLKDVFPVVLGELETALAWKLQTEPEVLLVGKKDTFEQMTGNPLVSAFALPSHGFIAVHLSPLGARPHILRETFSHELCHLLLHENIRDDLLPKWLDEGICQWVSGSLGEILSGEGLDLRAMDIPRRPIPLTKRRVARAVLGVLSACRGEPTTTRPPPFHFTGRRPGFPLRYSTVTGAAHLAPPSLRLPAVPSPRPREFLGPAE